MNKNSFYKKVNVGDIVRFKNESVDYYGIVVQKLPTSKYVKISWLNHKYYSFDIAESYELTASADKYWSVV